MTAAQFRTLALGFADATEGSHMGHADFRVGGRIFASLGPKEDWGMVKLKPDEQSWFMQSAPSAFRPANGAWGRNGSTIVELRAADRKMVKEALRSAWECAASRPPRTK